jgi:hypothetical protein
MTWHGKGPCDDIAEQIEVAFGKSLPPATHTDLVADKQILALVGKNSLDKN